MSEPEVRDLLELSRHYDSMLWTVTSIWAAAIGGLLLYSSQHFDAVLSTFGLGFTVCAAYFAYSFRCLRRTVHAQLPKESGVFGLLVRGSGLLQWDTLAVVFLGLVFLWARLLMQQASHLGLLWLALSLSAAFFIGGLWVREARRSDA